MEETIKKCTRLKTMIKIDDRNNSKHEILKQDGADEYQETHDNEK